jgi:hypothetical protein
MPAVECHGLHWVLLALGGMMHASCMFMPSMQNAMPSNADYVGLMCAAKYDNVDI